MPHVLLVCSGLDHARRGYESFARECFGQLRHDPRIRLELIKGSGAISPGESTGRTLRRDTRLAQALGQAAGVPAFRIESLAFAISLQPILAKRRPDVVYTSEWDTARGLAKLRAVARGRFKLLLCNGGFAEQGFEHLDHVQELTPAAYDHVVRHGAEPSRHTILPLGFTIPSHLAVPSSEERAALRRQWALPSERRIVVSVAALNRSHKRLDYLIDELAGLPEPRPFLLLVGEPDGETPQLRALAGAKLGVEDHRFLTLPAERVPDVLRASDVFVLASLAEMQGRAAIEAMAHGLPCLVHDSLVMQFAVGRHGVLGNFEQKGSLTQLLMRELAGPPDPTHRQERHAFVYERFSWDSLRPRYIELLTRVAQGRAANNTVSSSAGEKLSMNSR